MKRFERIASFLGLRKSSDTKPYKQLISSLASEALIGEIKTEESPFVYSPKLLQEFEHFYKRDGVIYGLVNRLVRGVTGVPYTIHAPPAIMQEFKEWLERPQVNFKEILKAIVQDVLVYGSAWIELIPNRAKNDIARLKRIDPKTMDFKRDNFKRVILDDFGYPVAVVHTPPRTTVPIEIEKQWVAHFAFYKTAEDWLGISPLEALYHLLKYKMNIENSLAEGLYRQTYSPIIAYIGDENNPPEPSAIEAISSDLKEFHKKLALIVPYYVRVERAPETRGRPPEKIIDFITYLDAIIREAFGVGAKLEEGRIPLIETTIKAHQESLTHQLREEIFKQLAKLRGWVEIPYIEFAESSPETVLIQSRACAYLARQGVLTKDKNLENYWRAKFGIPLLEGEQGEHTTQ